MTRYIIRRLLQAIPLLLLISVAIFILVNNIGDPLISFAGDRKRLRPEDRVDLSRRLGLDRPLPTQYVFWLIGNDWLALDINGDGIKDENGVRKGVLRGDFGNSFGERRPVVNVIAERIPNTMLLMLSVEVVVLLFSLLIGIYSALHKYSLMDNLITGLSFIGYSMPIFWLALALMYIFSVHFRRWGLPYFPIIGMYDLSVGPTVKQVLWHMALPLASLSIISIAGYSRYVRSQMLEVIQQDYIRTAYAKGLSGRSVLYRHALKNASLPLVTIVGMDLPMLVGGAIVTETIFGWPGMGRLFYDSAKIADIPVLMGIMCIISILVVVFQILTDVTYTFLDPRIRYN